jgi:hypothetical protein
VHMNSAATISFIRGSDVGSALNVLGVTHIYKATGTETAGSSRYGKPLFRQAQARRRTPIPERTKPSMF